VPFIFERRALCAASEMADAAGQPGGWACSAVPHIITRTAGTTIKPLIRQNNPLSGQRENSQVLGLAQRGPVAAHAADRRAAGIGQPQDGAGGVIMTPPAPFAV